MAVHFHTLRSDLDRPTSVVVDDTSHILYICEQKGLIKKLDLLSKETSIFLDIQEKVVPLNEYDERGLLSMVINSERNEFYLFYSTPLHFDYHHNRVTKFSFSNLKEEEILLDIPMIEDIHNGGRLLLGDKDTLYVSVGDGSEQKDLFYKAQNLNNFYGKILAINLVTKKIEIFASGFRNVWSLSWWKSLEFGERMIAGDVGYQSREEVNIIQKGGNYGWNYKEGTLRTSWTQDKQIPLGLIDPIYEYPTHSFPEVNYYPQASAITGVIGLPYVDQFIIVDYSGIVMKIEKIKGEWKRTYIIRYPETIRGLFDNGKEEGMWMITSTKLVKVTQSTLKEYTNMVSKQIQGLCLSIKEKRLLMENQISFSNMNLYFYQ